MHNLTLKQFLDRKYKQLFYHGDVLKANIESETLEPYTDKLDTMTKDEMVDYIINEVTPTVDVNIDKIKLHQGNYKRDLDIEHALNILDDELNRRSMFMIADDRIRLIDRIASPCGSVAEKQLLKVIDDIAIGERVDRLDTIINGGYVDPKGYK